MIIYSLFLPAFMARVPLSIMVIGFLAITDVFVYKLFLARSADNVADKQANNQPGSEAYNRVYSQ